MSETASKFKTHPRQVVINQAKIIVKRLMQRIPDSVRNPVYASSLKKYDRRAGTYVAWYNKSLISDEIGEVIFDGKRKTAPRLKTFLCYLDWLAAELRSLGLQNASLLEVGAGELTTWLRW